MTNAPSATQVLISGGGPVGLSAAVELGLRGVECVLVEPRLAPTRTRPRAKTLNVRTMEHLRRWGLADRLRERAPLPTWWSTDVAFCTALLGHEITRFHGVLGLAHDGVSPELGQQEPQYVYEGLLREVVADLPTCRALIGSTVRDLSQADDRVDVIIESPDGSRQPIRAEFVIGADGARSVVRDAIGARYAGSTANRANLGVMFRCPPLMGLLPEAPAVQSWVINDVTPAVMGPVDRDGTWWIIAFGIDSAAAGIDLEALVHGALGGTPPVEVVSTDPWVARMELVDRARSERVFLIGDAAHLNPPFGGHGLNTGIGDAVDLGWKIAANLQGWGGPGLLDSYEAERRPLQQRVIAEAAANGSVLSGRFVRDGLDDPGPRGAQLRAAAATEIQATKAMEFFSLDLVLGHRYDHSPVIPEAAVDISEDDWAAVAAPGRRLPHRRMPDGRSTLDLIGPGLTVLNEGGAEVGTLVGIARSLDIPLTVHHLESTGSTAPSLQLVRPDQIVAWCGPDVPAAPEALLRTVTGRL